MSPPVEINFWTKRALLNNVALDFICPPNCEKNKIFQTGNSAIEALIKAKQNIYSNKIINNFWHYSTKPIKAYTRMLYTILVTMTVSPLGACYHGTITIKKLVEYKWSNDTYLNKEEKWKEVISYFKAFTSDFSCFFVGAVLGSFLAFSFTGTIACLNDLSAVFAGGNGMTLIETISNLAIFLLLDGSPIFMLETHAPSMGLARFLGTEESKTGMYLVLEMRNKLGLVDQNGHLLNFSARDRLEYQTSQTFTGTNFRFSGNVINNLRKLTEAAEFDLIDLVKEASEWLTNHNEPAITYTYPLNGNAIAVTLENALHKKIRLQDNSEKTSLNAIGKYSENFSSTYKLIEDLKKLDYKINVFLDFYKSVQELAMKPSIALELLYALAKKKINISLEKEKSCISPNIYFQYFNHSYFQSTHFQNFNNTDFHSEFLRNYENLGCINPNTPFTGNPSDLSSIFLQRVQKINWHLKNTPNTPLNLEKVIDLAPEFSYQEMKTAFRKYSLALHPDKGSVLQNDENVSKELFKAFGMIKTEIENSLKQNI